MMSLSATSAISRPSMTPTRHRRTRASRVVRPLDRLTFVLAVTAMMVAPACAAAPPVLQNQSVVYRWAPPQNGAGLIAIDDLVNGKSLIDVGQESPAWWRVKLKDQRTISNTDLPCKITAGDGSLTFTWTGEIRVTVNAHLDGSMLRSRIKVNAVKEGVGLRDVVFPVVDGIRPLAQDAADDRLLHAFRTGYTEPTPPTTGKPVHMRYCIG